MQTEFSGGPVDGGTFPALIWASVISAWEEIKAERAAETGEREGGAPSGEAPSRRRAKRKATSRPSAARSRIGRTAKTPAPEAEAGARTRSRPNAGGGTADSGPRSALNSAGAGGGITAELRRRRLRIHAGAACETNGTAREAEAPGAVNGFGDPDPGAGDDLACPARLGRQQQERDRAARSAPLASSPMPSASVSLPGPEQSSVVRALAAPGAHLLEAGGRLERADQDRRCLALRLGDRVEQAVDAVGEVDVGAARAGRRASRCAGSGRRRRGRPGRRARSSRSRRSCRRNPRRRGGSRSARAPPSCTERSKNRLQPL